MKYQIVELKNYNAAGDLISTKYICKEQKSFLGIKYWKRMIDIIESVAGNMYIPMKTNTKQGAKDYILERIAERNEKIRTKIVKTESKIIETINK